MATLRAFSGTYVNSTLTMEKSDYLCGSLTIFLILRTSWPMVHYGTSKCGRLVAVYNKVCVWLKTAFENLILELGVYVKKHTNVETCVVTSKAPMNKRIPEYTKCDQHV